MTKQKIVITGGLGYLGTELCKLYSGESRYKEIVVIDTRFLSEKVSQLRRWNIQFIQGSILDKDRLSELLHDADIVYHLAGITDVAYTATQSNKEQDELIRSVGVDGTRNVLAAIPAKCKLIFPSTHVVFEGLSETTFDLNENSPVHPVLTYAQGKQLSEMDIFMHSQTSAAINHVIVRLGSVYGYSGDTMRINIMPNKFASIAAQDGTISMFGGGVQYKSLVHVVDVVRAMKFLAESDHTGTYHLSNENMTVKQVAQICKDVNPKVTLLETSDEIPNKGYTLSNAKLLSTGFQFRYNIRDAIADMIHKWSHKDLPADLECIIGGDKDYIDSRGRISNYELLQPINLIGYITSVKGSVRANHYHPIQTQQCLLVSGRYISVTKDLSYPDAPLQYKTIRAGDIAVIQPNVAHAMVFLQDSVFLNLVNGEREHENYGVTHTLPYQLVDDTFRDFILDTYGYTYKTECRVCSSRRLEQVLSLGDSPLANNLLNSAGEECPMYPLELMHCQDCYNVQLSVVIPATKLFDNYLYVSSTSPVFRQHFEQAAESYIEQFGLDERSVVWDIGSNDGIALKPLQEQGIQVCGIEPAANLADLANGNGISTIHGYFNNDTATQAYHKAGSPDIVTASNVFAHADDLKGITQAVFTNMKEHGVFIIEVQYLLDTILDLTFDNIYHEHVQYWSVTALNTFFHRLGYKLFHVEHIDTHGGSVRAYICNDDRGVQPSVQQYLTTESDFGIRDKGMLTLFASNVAAIRTNVIRNMATLRHLYPVICGYGSPAKATTALNYFGITSDDIQYTIEDNQLKQGKFLPGTGIPIWSHTYGPNKGPDVCVVLAWNFYDSIVQRHRYMTEQTGTQFISIKDLQLDPISFANLLSGKRTTDPNTYIIDTPDFAYKLVVGDYWKDTYKQKPISIIPDCYNSMLELIKKLPKYRTIVDIGANCGILSVPCALMGYHVVAFDPAQANVDALQAAMQVNNLTTLQVYQEAVSDHDGYDEMYIPDCPDNSAMDSDIAIAKMTNKVFTIEQVHATTFDTWISVHPTDVSLIKIDVQGHELQVIRGMHHYLAGARDLYILCEFDYSLDNSQQELYNLITSYGFKELPAITNEDKLFHKV